MSWVQHCLFVNSGWELGVQAAAELADQGGGFAGAVSISPGVWLYEIVGDGLALELTSICGASVHILYRFLQLT